MSVKILRGDCRDVLRTLPAASINCCVTSPPYFNLRRYLLDSHPDKSRELGQEQTPDDYADALVEVFREVRRTLRDDGVVFLNLGDSYAGGGYSNNKINGEKWLVDMNGDKRRSRQQDQRKALAPLGIKPKDLIGIPWMVAFALRADGWFLRGDHIWAKPNGMPESTADRPTRSHEYVFLLTKSSNYWYDQEAVRTAPKASTISQLAKPYLGQSTKDHESAGVQDASDIKRRIVEKMRKPRAPKYVGEESAQKDDIKARYYDKIDKQRGHSRRHEGFNDRWDAMSKEEQQIEGGNLRSVWWVAPAQYREGHFAVMPDMVAEICIRAGCPVGGTVLDPFSGAGTTALVADRLGRNCIGIELSETFADMAERRITKDAGMFADIQGE